MFDSLALIPYIYLCISNLYIHSPRIGHESFELINHDVVEPLYIEGTLNLLPFH